MDDPTTSVSSVSPPKEVSDAPAQKPIVGEWNVLEASIGQRGCGKSTYQAARAHELAIEAGGAYVIGHSLGQRMPERLPPELGLGDIKLPIVYHTSIAKLEKGLNRDPGKWHILAPPLPEERGHHDGNEPVDTADDLLRWSVRLSFAIRKQAWQREHPMRFWRDGQRTLGLRATPIIMILDEGIAVEAASTGARSRGDDKWFLQYIYSLRHMHIALLYSIQEPTSRSWRVLEAATAIHVFKSKHQWSLNAIEACGASPEQMEEIRALRPFERVTLR